MTLIRAHPSPTSQCLEDETPNPCVQHEALCELSFLFRPRGLLSPLLSMSQWHWATEAPRCLYNVPSTQNAFSLAWGTPCVNTNMTASGGLPRPLPHRVGFPDPSQSTSYCLFGAPITVGTSCFLPTCPTSLIAPRQGSCLSCSLPCLEYTRHSRNVC